MAAGSDKAWCVRWRRCGAWERVSGATGGTCAEFRQDFAAYLGNQLGASRRLLVDDHLSRCPACRAHLADMKGERTIIPMPVRTSSRWMRRGALLAAAASLVGALYIGRDTIDAMMAPLVRARS